VDPVELREHVRRPELREYFWSKNFFAPIRKTRPGNMPPDLVFCW